MKDKITCIIVDDDPNAIEILEDYISDTPALRLIKSYTNPVEALIEMVIKDPVDLLFLDIDMPGVSGLKFAEQVRKVAPNVIFTTGHVHYAPDAFKVWARGFLVKPIGLADFASTVTGVISMTGKLTAAIPGNELLFLRTKFKKEKVVVRKREIILIKSAGNYLKIITAKKEHIVYMTVKEMAEMLVDNTRFFQIRKSAIINADYLTKVDGNATYFDEHEVIMTQEYGAMFSAFVKNWTLRSNRNLDNPGSTSGGSGH